jgi:hypothetical protein
VKQIQTDNGTEFGEPFTWHLADLGISHRKTKIRSPEENGKVERSHRTDEEEFYRTHRFVSIGQRKIWQSEDYRMSIFDAAALGLAYLCRFRVGSGDRGGALVVPLVLECFSCPCRLSEASVSKAPIPITWRTGYIHAIAEKARLPKRTRI